MSTMDRAWQFQEKFELYLIALVFTVLGLAIQTAAFGATLPGDVAELCGWLFLLISGVVGLWRLEWLPIAYAADARIRALDEQCDRLSLMLKQGVGELEYLDSEQKADVARLLEQHAEGIRTHRAFKYKIGRGALWKYRVHKWGLGVGTACLVFARGYEPAIAVVGRINS